MSDIGRTGGGLLVNVAMHQGVDFTTASCRGVHLRISEILSKQSCDGVDVESAAVCALRHFLPLSSPLKLHGISDGLALVPRAEAQTARLKSARASAQIKRNIAPLRE